MRKRRLFFVLLLAILPFVGWAQQQNYDGQHVSIKRTTGDSIQHDLSMCWEFRPVIRDGKIVWSFIDVNNNGERIDKYAFDNVESFDFRSKEYDKVEVRKALTEFYQALDGDNWPHKDNWCSDKPIIEWYGVNVDCMGNQYDVPWVLNLDLTDFFFGQWDYSSGTLPECMVRMGPIQTLRMPNFMLKGNIPDFLGTMYSLREIGFYGNKLSGTIPESIGKLPFIWVFDIQHNLFEGQLQEEFICGLMDKLPGNNVNLNNNYFSGKIPKKIINHPQFCDFWPSMITQRGEGLDLSDLKIPAPTFSMKDINGNTIDLKEEYKKHKYTLLYKWGLWCPFSEALNQKMVPVYNAYKDKGFEIIGIHYDLNGDDGLVDYMQSHDIPWNNAIAKEWDWGGTRDGRAIFNWGGTPNVFLVDQNGVIVFNSLCDDKGQLPLTYDRNERLFSYLEEIFGPVEYNFYTSTDYSHDGEILTLQKATQGQGIDLVFIGEGYTDKDLENGEEFERYMKNAMNQFFSYEPYRSLQDRFNVYVVKAVSPNSEFYGNAVHAIDEDAAKAFEYASKIPDLIPNRPMHVCVIYKEDIGKRSYCNLLEDNSFVCYSMDGISNVLNHEAGGHGIGKLMDEYVEYYGLTLPEESKTELENQWTTKGWGANVDWRSDPTQVKWTKFISDARYADENIGVFEGSYLYQYGAYRPTENSMMRYNDTPFNAPSREEIYKRVMKESEGDSWTYDYEMFVAFDESGRSQFVDALTNASRRAPKAGEKQQVRTAPPVFLKGTWRDALNKK
jgi:thiol-disulfide isomerase/thioredoxin